MLIGFGKNEWVFNMSNYDPNKFSDQYVECLFWSIHMLTGIGEVDEPTTTAENLITIITFLIAMVLIASLVGNIGTVISNMNVQQSKFQEKLDAIKYFMTFRKVSEELDQRVIKWFAYLNKNNQTIDEKDILANLPDKLQVELASHIHLEALKKINIFSECDEFLLRELVTNLRLQVYSPGDFVCKKGDIGNEMFIIKKGSLNVVSDDGTKVFVTLKAGAFFGELSILNIPGIKTGNRRTANVQSVGFSDLLRLTKYDLWHVLVDYEADKRIIIRKGLEKCLKDNLLDETFAERFKNATDPNDNGQLDEIEFNGLKPDVKLDKLLSLYDKLLKRLEKLEEEFTEDCENIELKMKSLHSHYGPRIGTTV